MILDAISHRRACRSFKAESVPPALIEELIKAAQFAPTSRNRRPVEFVVVTDQKMRQAIHDVLVPQDFVAQAPVLIVPIANTQTANNPQADLALASQNIFLQATHLKLGSVWKHVHDGEEQEKLRATLGIPEHFLIMNVIPIGYPAEMPPPHTDAEFDAKKIHHEKF